MLSVTYSEWVFVALGMQHAMRFLHVICCLFRSTVFFHAFSQTVRFSGGGGERQLWDMNCAFWFYLQILS